jgi:hypothetical protein
MVPGFWFQVFGLASNRTAVINPKLGTRNGLQIYKDFFGAVAGKLFDGGDPIAKLLQGAE